MVKKASKRVKKPVLKQTELDLALKSAKAEIGAVRTPVPEGASRVRNGEIECGRYLITPKTEDVSDTKLKYILKRPVENTQGERPPEKDTSDGRRIVRGYDYRRYREQKKWIKILERFNYQYIIIAYMDNGFWAVHGHSAMILNYKICAKTAWQPRLSYDNDPFSRMSEGKIVVKAFDSLRTLLENSYYVEKLLVERRDLLIFELKKKISKTEYEEIKEQREKMMRAVEEAVSEVRVMPRLKMQLVETFELAFHYANHPTAVKNGTSVARRLVFYLDEAVRELYIVLKTHRSTLEGLERIETSIIAAQAELMLIGQLRVWSEKEVADVGFRIAECMKYLLIERKRAEQSGDGLEEQVKSGAAQKNG